MYCETNPITLYVLLSGLFSLWQNQKLWQSCRLRPVVSDCSTSSLIPVGHLNMRLLYSNRGGQRNIVGLPFLVNVRTILRQSLFDECQAVSIVKCPLSLLHLPYPAETMSEDPQVLYLTGYVYSIAPGNGVEIGPRKCLEARCKCTYLRPNVMKDFLLGQQSVHSLLVSNSDTVTNGTVDTAVHSLSQDIYVHFNK